MQYHDQAIREVQTATEDSDAVMERAGWHRCSEVLDESAAVIETEDQLSDPDYAVAVTRTCAGFIVWTKLTGD